MPPNGVKSLGQRKYRESETTSNSFRSATTRTSLALSACHLVTTQGKNLNDSDGRYEMIGDGVIFDLLEERG